MISDAATLVLLVGDRMVRADFALGAETPDSVLYAPRARGGSLAAAVRAALALNGKPRRRVWVMADELWTQSLALSGNQVRGLSETQIDRALSFEIEPFSGIPVAESVLGFRQTREINGASSFWVVEMTKEDRDAIQRTVQELGGRLEGIGHPGGLPHSLSKNGASWQRLEFWESGSVWISSDGEIGGVKAQVVNGLPPRAALPSGGTFELLGTRAAPTIPEAGADLPWRRFSLQDDEPLQTWLRHWRVTFSGKAPLLPMVVPAAAPPSPLKYIVGAAALLLAAVLLCSLHAWVVGRIKMRLLEDIAAHAGATRQLDELARQSTSLREQLARLQTAEQQRAEIVARRGSVGTMLRTMAAARPEEVVLKSIQVENLSSMIVNGMALESSAVDDLSLTLGDNLRAAGWQEQPLQKIALRRLANSGPWQFSLRLLHEEALNTPAAARPAAKGGKR